MSGNSIRVSVEVVDQFTKPLESFSQLLGSIQDALDDVDFSSLYEGQIKTTQSFADFSSALVGFGKSKEFFSKNLKSLTGSTNKLKSSFGNVIKTLGPSSSRNCCPW